MGSKTRPAITHPGEDATDSLQASGESAQTHNLLTAVTRFPPSLPFLLPLYLYNHRASLSLPFLSRAFSAGCDGKTGMSGQVRGHLLTLASSLIFQIMSSMQAAASSLESWPSATERKPGDDNVKNKAFIWDRIASVAVYPITCIQVIYFSRGSLLDTSYRERREDINDINNPWYGECLLEWYG